MNAAAYFNDEQLWIESVFFRKSEKNQHHNGRKVFQLKKANQQSNGK